MRTTTDITASRMQHPTFSDIPESRMNHPTFSDTADTALHSSQNAYDQQ
tara:strand:- start:290 stop:436 length:147 start_codon:yes stop_codon:yes gene_type:complete